MFLSTVYEHQEIREQVIRNKKIYNQEIVL